MAAAPAKTETDPATDAPVDTAESSVEAPTAAPAEPGPYAAAAGDTVKDSGGRIGLVVAADKDRGGAEIPNGESVEPMVIWLGEASAFGGELSPVE